VAAISDRNNAGAYKLTRQAGGTAREEALDRRGSFRTWHGYVQGAGRP
jgi:hypothetical protein